MGSDRLQHNAGAAHPSESSAVPFIGLTGAVATGKSEALAAFGRLGAAVLSADSVVHELLAESDVVAKVTERFGSGVAPGGEVDRDLLAKVVFDDDEARRWLEQTVWPLVGLRMWEWRTQQAQADPRPRASVIEVPLLFESGMDQAFDTTVCVVSDQAKRVERAAARGQVAVDERTNKQLSQHEKAARSDHVVQNDGSIEELQAKLSDLLETIVTDGNTNSMEN